MCCKPVLELALNVVIALRNVLRPHQRLQIIEMVDELQIRYPVVEKRLNWKDVIEMPSAVFHIVPIRMIGYML